MSHLYLFWAAWISNLHTDRWACDDAPYRSAGIDCDVRMSVGRSWRQTRGNENANAIESVAGWGNWHAGHDAPQCSPANADGDSASNPPTSDGDDNVSLNCSPRAVDWRVHPLADDDSVDNY